MATVSINTRRFAVLAAAVFLLVSIGCLVGASSSDDRAKAKAFYDKGMALYKDKDYSGAEAAFQEALKLEPANRNIKNALKKITALSSRSKGEAPEPGPKAEVEVPEEQEPAKITLPPVENPAAGETVEEKAAQEEAAPTAEEKSAPEVTTEEEALPAAKEEQLKGTAAQKEPVPTEAAESEPVKSAGPPEAVIGEPGQPEGPVPAAHEEKGAVLQPLNLKDGLKELKSLYSQKKYADAKKRAQEILSSSPDNKEAQKYIVKIDGEVQKENTRLEKIKKRDAKKLIDKKTDDLVMESKALYKKKDYDGAKAKCEEALDLNPRDRDALNQIAIVNRRLDYIASQKDEENEVIRKKESDPKIAKLLSESKELLKKKDYDGAKAKCNEVLSLDPNDRDALNMLDRIGRQLHDMEKKSKEISPEDKQINGLKIDNLVSESKKLYSDKDYEGAEEKAREALRIDPRDRDALNQKAFVDRRLELINAKKDRLQKEAEKKEKRARDKELARQEKNAFGLFGVKEDGLTELLNAMPAKDIPQRPLEVKECVQIALKNNIRLEVAAKTYKLARIRVIEAKRNLWPTIKGLWEESGGKVSGRFYDGKKANFDYQQPVYHGGELVFSVKQAEVNCEVAQYDYNRVKNELVLGVEKAYYSLDKSIKAEGIQNKIYGQVLKINDQTKRGFDQGAIAKIEYLAVLAKYNQISFQLTSAKEDVVLAKLILSQAMNTEENVDIVTVGEPEIKSIDLGECYRLALKNRPEIRVNYLMVAYYMYEKQISIAKTRPKVDFMGNWGYAFEDFIPKDNDEGHTSHKFQAQWYTGIKAAIPFGDNTITYSMTKETWQPVVSAFQGTESLTHDMGFNLFDGIQRGADVLEADIGLGKAQQEYDRTKQEVVMEVQEQYFKYKKAMIQMDVARSKCAYQGLELDITEAKKEMNESSGSQVIDELIKNGEEEFGLIQAILDYFIALKSLNKAIGMNGYF